MEPSRDDKTKATHDVIKSVLGMADDQKAKMKSVKIKIKFDNKKVNAIKKKAASMGSRLSDSQGVTR
jgi:hypothetical protein